MLDDKVQKALKELKEDTASGAQELFLKAIDIIKNQMLLVSDENKDIKPLFFELASEIIHARPSMAPLINSIGYIINNLKTYTRRNIIDKILNLVKFNAERRNKLMESFVYFFNSYYKRDIKIMLLSYSSSIINTLVYLKDYNSILYILESRPLCEGHRTAEILSQYFETYLIIDAAMGKYIDKIDLVLIGIDSILEDGSIINKIGTYPLAVVAKDNDIPVYGIADSFKYNLRSHFNQKVEIGKKPSKEVYDKKIRSNLLHVHNTYFDITPPKYIKGIISDLGVLSPEEFVEKAKSVLPVDWFQDYI